MANLGLLGAVAGLGKGLQDFGAELVARREKALEWAQKLAEDQRKEAADAQARQETFAQQDKTVATEQGGMDRRTQATIDADAARQKALFGHEDVSREDTQQFTAQQNAIDHAATLDRETAIEQLRHQDDIDSKRLEHQLSQSDVAGIKYGEKYSVNPKSGRPYADPNSPYAEVLLVKKDGSIVHTGKLMLAPQQQQQDDSDPYAYQAPPAVGVH